MNTTAVVITGMICLTLVALCYIGKDKNKKS